MIRVRDSGAAGALTLLLCFGCHEAPPAQQAASETQPALADETTATADSREALPRAVLGVQLGMAFADARKLVGELTCHANQAGYQVCTSATAQRGEVKHLELYVHHDQVISVSYEGAAPQDVRGALTTLIDRYGHPSLSGMRERDKSGRVHEIYGWKDEHSLYSVRFMWRNMESDNPELVGVVTALWDRKGYQQWEIETKGGGAAPLREPI